MKKSRMIILVGPSGAGKSTLSNYICNLNLDIHRLVAVTTRKPRLDEVDGIDKYFVDMNTYEEWEKQDFLCLSNLVYNHYYAFLKQDFWSGKNYICELYYKNLKDFLKYHDKSTSIYIRPKNMDECRKRIMSRNALFEENQIREEKVKTEMEILDCLADNKYFDYKIINNYDVETKKKFVDLIKEIMENINAN